MRKYLHGLLLTLTLALIAFPAVVQAQGDSATITTAGADCSTATNCAIFGTRGYASLGIYLNVGTSGTFVFEATTDTDSNTSIWFAIDDDIGSAGTATADGAYFFTNPGYSFIRIRASAISGAATLHAFRGFAGLRSTASLSGASQGDGAIQDGASAAIEATVADLTNSNPLASMIVDANGDQITSFGGGTQYTNGTAEASPIGTISLGFDGANVRAFATNGSGHLNVIFPSAQAVTGSGNFTVVNAGTFATQAAQSGTWNINNVSGTITLPTGASTSANQTTMITHLDAIETATEAAQASLSSIENALSSDAIEGNAAIATGPQTMLKVQATPTTVDDGDAVAWRGSTKGDAYTYIRDAAGNERGANVNASNQLLTASTLQAGSALVGRVQLDAQAANGADGFRYTSAGSTEDEHAVKASAGVLYSITVTNTNAAARYLRCANAVAGSTTPGSTTPIIDLAVPGATTGAGFTTQFPMGLTFSTALTCWLVTGAADTDVTEVAANELKVLYTYK